MDSMLRQQMVACSLITCSFVIGFSVAAADEEKPRTTVQSNEDFDVDGDEKLAASLFDAVCQNNRAIQNFDVAFTSEFVVLRPQNELITSVLRVRYVSDSKETAGLYALSRDVDRVDDKDVVSTSSRVVAYFLDASPNAVMVDAKGTHRFPNASKEIRDLRIGIPKLHSLGFVTFLHTSPFLGEDDPYWESLTIPQQDAVAKILEDGRAKVVQRHTKDGRETAFSVYLFDMKTLMPQKRTRYYLHTETKERHVAEVEDYRWKMVGGIYVPDKIRSELMQIAVDKETGVELPYSETYTSTFAWRVVNDDIDMDKFSRQEISTAADVQRVLDEGFESK